MKAYVDLDRLTEARELLERLYAARRPDWRETLEYWERALDDKTRGFGPVNEPVPAVGILQLVGPTWCREKEGFATLLAPKAPTAPRIAVMMPSSNPSKPSGVAVSQRTNVEGSLGRSIGLALAESVHLDTSAVGVALVPIVVAPSSPGGFVLAEAPWSVEVLRNGVGDDVTAIALLHLNARVEPWLLSMSVHAMSAGASTPVRQIEVPVDPSRPEGALASLQAVLKSAVIDSGAAPATRPEWARTPEGNETASWLAGTEQCLAVVCADPSGGGPTMSLYGERSIVDGILSAALAKPESAPWRMLLATTLSRLVEVRPEVAAEYFERAERLMREHAIGGDIGPAIARVLSALRKPASGKRDPSQ